jgi:hypothetical protein
MWLQSGSADDRWDRQPRMPLLGIAFSSQRRTANGEPLRVDELVGFLRETVEPPSTAALDVVDCRVTPLRARRGYSDVRMRRQAQMSRR